MSLIIAATLVVVGQQPGQMSVEEFTAKYKQAYVEVAARYTNLHIRETKVLGDGTIHKREGYLHGDYIKVVTADSRFTWVQLLSRKASMRLRSVDEGKSWTLDEYIPMNEVGYESRRPQVQKMMAEALYLPFKLGPGPAQNFLDVLEGKTAKAPMGAGGKLEVKPDREQSRGGMRLTKIEELRSPGHVKYRAHMGYFQGEHQVEEAYVEIDPQLGWMITKGHTHSLTVPQGLAWTIEYGGNVNGVPFMKKYTFYGVKYDPKTGAEIVVEDRKPYVVTVDLAEPYEQVNPEEFEPAFYHVEVPEVYDPNRKQEIPTALYYALAAVVGFMAIVLALHFARQRRKSRVVMPPGPTS